MYKNILLFYSTQKQPYICIGAMECEDRLSKTSLIKKMHGHALYRKWWHS